MPEKTDATRIIREFFDLINNGEVVLKTYVNDDVFCSPNNAMTFSSKPGEDEYLFSEYGANLTINKRKKPIEFFTKCFTTPHKN